MVESDSIPKSWVTVHRTVAGNHDRCLDVAVDATEDDPVLTWLTPGLRQRRLNVGYMLLRGFKEGRVTFAQPRAGVCVATRLRRSWSPRVWWWRARLLASLSSDERDRLREIETAVDENVKPGTWWVRCVAVRKPFRNQGIEDQLLRQALEASSEFVIYQQFRSKGAKVLQEQGGEKIAEVTLSTDSLCLYRVSTDALRKGRKRATSA